MRKVEPFLNIGWNVNMHMCTDYLLINKQQWLKGKEEEEWKDTKIKGLNMNNVGDKHVWKHCETHYIVH